MPRLLGPAAVAVCAAAAAGYLYAVDPSQPGHYPACPLKSLTGLDCPGCGGLRAAHELLHGDVMSAVDHNALAVLVLLPLAVVLAAGWVSRRGGRGWSPTWPSWAVPALIYLTIVFTAVRNLPGVPLNSS